MTIDDSSDSTGQTATLDDGSLTWSNYAAPITWTPTASDIGGVSSVTINGGSGGNTFTVNNNGNLYLGAALNTGTGTNTVDVLGTRSDLFIQGNGGQDTVFVGSSDGSSGSLAAIHGQVSVKNTSAGATALTIDDSADTIGRTATLGSFFYFDPLSMTFIHVGELSWNAYAADIAWYPAEGVSSVTINGGSGNIKTFNVINTDPFGIAANTTLNTGPGNNTVKMLGGFSSPLTVNGQGAFNTLDYSGYTGDVTVDLPLGYATFISGGISGFQNVIGSNGNDILVGDGRNDYLVGGTGRNLLIAGAGAGDLVGNAGDDIVIGGSTQCDSDLASLDAIMSEWTRTDVPYSARVRHIMDGGGINGSALLNASTVTGNGGGNILTGAGGLNLYFGSLDNDQTDYDPNSGEVFVSV